MDQKEFFKSIASNPENFELLTECPWCGEGESAPWGGDKIYPEFQMAKCLKCGVVYAKRRLNAAARKKLADGYMEVRQDEVRATKRDIAHKQELDFIYRHIPDGRTVLDVGCGGGFLLEKMKGWDRYGTELGELACHRASNAIGLGRVFLGELEDINFHGKKFDLVIIRGVIEHVPYPKRFIETAVKLVNYFGFIYMSGPNLDSFCAQFYRDRWRLHYPAAHLCHFSVPIITKALSRHDIHLVAEHYPYMETPYAHVEEDILQIAEDINAKLEGDEISEQSPPFFGSRYMAMWQKPGPWKSVPGNWEE